MTFCPHCDFMNSDQNIYCASCGKPLKNQSVEIERVAPTHPPPSNVERNAIAGCCVLSILLFFFPLLTIHVPIAGEQDVSGYDVFSKLTEFREKLKPPDGSQTNPYSATPRTPPPDMPLSIQLGWLTPLASNEFVRRRSRKRHDYEPACATRKRDSTRENPRTAANPSNTSKA